VRYARWVARAARGDLGLSYRTGAPVENALVERLPSTIELAAASLFLSILVALPLGAAAALRQGTWVDHLSRVIALFGTSVPSFLLGYALMLLFAVSLHLLPVAGSDGPASLVMPVLTLAMSETAALTRLTRASMLDVLGEDYVRTARAKGLPQRLVVIRHALRNALNPLVTLTGVRAGRLLGGAVIVETIFARPGIGKLVVDSIHDRDYPLIQGFVLLMGTVFVLANLIVDLSYAGLDPRVRLSGGPRGDPA
jgi:peptide/nickel transport system permease protein